MKVTEDIGQSTQRRYDIDALRVIALALLIIYHIFVAYQPFASAIQFIQYDQLLTEYWFVAEIFNIWRIPVLFLISGMAVGFILRRRTVKEVVADRMMRLVPPLVFGSLVFCPAYVSLQAVYLGEASTYQPTPGHLWFVWSLVTYAILLLPLILYFKRRPDNLIMRVLRATFPFGLLIFLPLPLVLETVLSEPWEFAFFPVRMKSLLNTLTLVSALLFGMVEWPIFVCIKRATDANASLLGQKKTVLTTNKRQAMDLWTAVAWKPNGEKCPVTNVVDGNK